MFILRVKTIGGERQKISNISLACKRSWRYLSLLGIVMLLSFTGCSVYQSKDSDIHSKYDSQPGLASGSNGILQSDHEADQAYIKHIQTIGITSSAATVTWSTDYPSSGSVQWGKTTDCESTIPVNLKPGSQPAVRLTGLTAKTTYYYGITLNGKSGMPITSPIQTFETLDPLYTRSLLISSVSVSELTGNSATIAWTTNAPSICRVEYGTNLPYGNITGPNGSPLYSHAVTLTNLADNAFYHFRVGAIDLSGNVTASEDTIFLTPSIQSVQNTDHLASHCGCHGRWYAR
jgi:hypothetical protein